MQIIKSNNQSVPGDAFKHDYEKKSYEGFKAQVYAYLVKKDKNAKKIINEFQLEKNKNMSYQVVKELVIYRRMVMEGLKNAGQNGEPCKTSMKRYLSKNLSRDRRYFDENYGSQKRKEVFEVGYV